MKTDDLICMMAKAPPCSCAKRNARIWLRIIALFLAYLTLVVVTLGLRPNLSDIPHDPQMMFKYAYLAAIMVGSGIAWWYSGHPGRTYRISFYGLIFMGVFLACAAVHALYVEKAAALPQVFNYTAFVCAGFITVFATLGTSVLVCISRCMAPTNCRVHAFMTGLFAASIGAFAYAMHCPHDHPAYLALWYGGTALAFTLLSLPVIMKKQDW